MDDSIQTLSQDIRVLIGRSRLVLKETNEEGKEVSSLLDSIRLLNLSVVFHVVGLYHLLEMETNHPKFSTQKKTFETLGGLIEANEQLFRTPFITNIHEQP
jgi:hypothetical protein